VEAPQEYCPDLSTRYGPAIRPISEGTRRRAAEAICRLRALQEAILADRGGKPFTEDELTAALHEARAAHERGE